MEEDEAAVEALLDRYYDEASQNGPDVVRFVAAALAGAFGHPDPVALLRFLDRLEPIILANIETRLEETPGADREAEDALRSIATEFAEARERILSHETGD